MGADGYSSSKNKRGGGIFRHESLITFNYAKADRTLEEMKKVYADLGRKIKSSKNVTVKDGQALTNLAVAREWRKTIKYRIRDIAVTTTAEMKDEILKGIGGRIETGTMKGSIRGRTTGNADKQESRAGWLDLWFKYFGFQEEGTKGHSRSGPSLMGGNFGYTAGGIKPMNALLRGIIAGRNHAITRLQKMVRDDLRSGGRGNVRRG